jgi:hypothetical protein
MRGLSGNNNYQAIECMIAPKQGRSGGGLFTTDGYIAGVCNFAEPRGDHGLYATPRSIYSVLDRNDLAALYSPVTGEPGTLLASRGDGSRRRAEAPITIARAQSPEGHEPERQAVRPGDVTVPDPEILGIKPPVTARRTSSGAESSTRRMAWHPTHTSPAPQAELQTDLNIDPSADHDHFSQFDFNQGESKSGVNDEDVPAVSTTTAPANGSKPRWRASRSAEGRPISESQED